jgi:cell division protein ZapD
VNDIITYEQPLNEIIRTCLRLEHLFQQINHQLHDTTTLGTRHLMSLIINLLHLLERPDLKSKLAKELTHHQAMLLRHEKTIATSTDQQKYDALLKKIEELTTLFINSSGKIAQPLRDIELLNNLRLHLASPAFSKSRGRL